MTFKSFIYKPNPKKVKEDKMSLLYLAGIVLFLVLIFIFFVRGILGIGFLVFVAGGLIKLKIDEIKNKGVNRFGSLPFAFMLEREAITIANREFRLEAITGLKIEADDFMGGSGGDIFSSSLGIDNFIEFTHEGEKHSYQFQVKKRSDLQLIQQIYTEMKNERVIGR